MKPYDEDSVDIDELLVEYGIRKNPRVRDEDIIETTVDASTVEIPKEELEAPPLFHVYYLPTEEQEKQMGAKSSTARDTKKKAEPKPKKAPAVSEPKSKGKSIIKNMLFYGCLVGIIAFLLFAQQDSHSPFGFGFFYIRTGSMEPEIPVGAAILTQNVDPKDIETGDVITFQTTSGQRITHEVVEILTGDSNQLSFRTKGIANSRPDEELVSEERIQGKVIFSVPIVGYIMYWIEDNVILALVIFALFCLLFKLIRQLLKKEDEDEEEEQVES